MRAANSQQPAGAAQEEDSDGRSETAGGGQPRKNFLYVEPSKRVKEILEEELCFWKEECHIRHPAAGLEPKSKFTQNELQTIGFTDENVQKLGDVVNTLSGLKTI